jgi:coproporphyrinogen III oxidase
LLAAGSIRARFEKVIRGAQDSICAAITEIDGKPFHQDAWTREGGGGGITRVLQVCITNVLMQGQLRMLTQVCAASVHRALACGVLALCARWVTFMIQEGNVNQLAWGAA